VCFAPTWKREDHYEGVGDLRHCSLQLIYYIKRRMGARTDLIAPFSHSNNTICNIINYIVGSNFVVDLQAHHILQFFAMFAHKERDFLKGHYIATTRKGFFTTTSAYFA